MRAFIVIFAASAISSLAFADEKKPTTEEQLTAIQNQLKQVQGQLYELEKRPFTFLVTQDQGAIGMADAFCNAKGMKTIWERGSQTANRQFIFASCLAPSP